MRHTYGTAKVVTASTAVQISNQPQSIRARAIFFKARPTNGANMWLGADSAVSTASGWELPASASLEFNRDHYGSATKDGSMEIATFWVTAVTTGLQLDWFATLEN